MYTEPELKSHFFKETVDACSAELDNMRNTGNQVGKVLLSHLCGQSQGPSQSNVEIEREKKEMQAGKETKWHT